MCKNKLLRNLLTTLLFAGAFYAAGNEPLPVATAIRIHDAVQLDGHLQEKFWKSIPEMTQFHMLGRRTQALQKTAFQIAYTDDFLLIGIFCAEQEMDLLSARASQRDENQVCSDDSVEFFLQPDNGFYYQFAVNAAGITYDGRRPAAADITPAQMQAGLLWDGAWEAMVHRGRDFWSAELRIPFAILDLGNSGKGIWRINLGRTESRLGYSSWSPVQKGFHDRACYGSLQGIQINRDPPRLDTTRLEFQKLLFGRNKLLLKLPIEASSGHFQAFYSLRIWEPGLQPERTPCAGHLLPGDGLLSLELDLNIGHPEKLQELTVEIKDAVGKTQAVVAHLFRPPKPFAVTLPWSCFASEDRLLPVYSQFRVSPESADAILHLQLYRAGWSLPVVQKRIRLRQPGNFSHMLPLRKLPEHGTYQLFWKLDLQDSSEACSGSNTFFFLK